MTVDKPVYSPGDTIRIISRALNTNPFPLVEGSVRAQILYQDGEEEYILDEFYLAEGISLLPNESIKLKGSWKVPKSAKAGSYAVAIYFIVADSFNMRGVSFLRGVYGEFMSFRVEGGADLVYFDTSNLMINGQSVSLHSPSTAYNDSEVIKVEIPIVNEGAPAAVRIKYELYAWDDIRSEDLLPEYTEQESLQMSSGESRALSYTIPASLPPGAYLLRATATSSKNKAILKVRLPVLGKMVKLNFAGIDSFPLKKGEPIKLFLCASNVAEYGITMVFDNATDIEDEPGEIRDASLRLSLEADGKVIFGDGSDGVVISGVMDGYEAEFIPEAYYKLVTLKAEAEDEDGNIEYYELVYDFDQLFKGADISLDVSVSSGNVKTTVDLERSGSPASGNINLYIKDSEGAAIVLERDIRVEGSFEKTFQLSPGKYVLKAVDLAGWNDAELGFEVPAPAAPPPVTDEQPAQDDALTILILLVVIIIAFSLFRKYTR